LLLLVLLSLFRYKVGFRQSVFVIVIPLVYLSSALLLGFLSLNAMSSLSNLEPIWMKRLHRDRLPYNALSVSAWFVPDGAWRRKRTLLLHHSHCRRSEVREAEKKGPDDRRALCHSVNDNGHLRRTSLRSPHTSRLQPIEVDAAPRVPRKTFVPYGDRVELTFPFLN